MNSVSVKIWVVCFVLVAFGGAWETSVARPQFEFPQTGGPILSKPAIGTPNINLEVHKVNRLALSLTNKGFFGTGYYSSNPLDPETGLPVLACEYPINSDVEYLWVGGLWLGAVIGRDTLVSTGAEGYYFITEFFPDAGDEGRMERKSTRPFSRNYSPDAVSEEDIIAIFTDTLTHSSYVTEDPIDNRAHQPLNVKIVQKSYAWSYPYAEDFILFDYEIENIGVFPLKQLYIGLVVDADAFHMSTQSADGAWLDDICGFKKTIPSPFWPGYVDTIMASWVADNDGDPHGGVFDFASTTGVTATRVIRTPSDSMKYSFNWWVTRYTPSLDWGPRQVTEEKPFRDFGPNFGTPLGDKNKYYMLSTGEFDYDQLECAVTQGNGWLSPPRDAADYADGHNAIYLLSFGPFDVAPGEILPFTMAYIGGEDLHHDPHAFETMYSPLNPQPYMDQLDFSDLGMNSIWADWIYDNPGFDTDNDGDSGLARWFYNIDSSDSTYAFYKGDGVPDFRGAAPPPSPKLNVTSGLGKLTLRWNGQVSENFLDVFSGQKDFEGYKIYFAEDNRFSDFVLVATYDYHDYDRFMWDDARRMWVGSLEPILYDSLLAWYGADFDPDMYTEEHPLPADDDRNITGRFTYFSPQYWNNSDLSDPHGIHKIYPDANLADPTDTTADGYHRYYEYKFVFENLSPAKPLYVSVTSFDYGSRKHKLSVLESSVLENDTLGWPLTSTEEVEDEALGVVVFPNPYRIDGRYAGAGYENRDRTKSAERARSINFANLPRICTIRIYTLTGDLVQEIDHYRPGGGPTAQHESWNMLSRNTQAITSGIYIWSVTSEMGEQLGKLVIIK